MTNLEDKEIKEQVYMEMLKNGKGESVIRKIDEINRRISRVVRKSSYVGSKGRYNDLMREIKGIVNGIGKELMHAEEPEKEEDEYGTIEDDEID